MVFSQWQELGKESVEGGYSIIVPKCGFYLRAAFTIFSSKIAAFIRARLLLEGSFNSKIYGTKKYFKKGARKKFLKISMQRTNSRNLLDTIYDTAPTWEVSMFEHFR